MFFSSDHGKLSCLLQKCNNSATWFYLKIDVFECCEFALLVHQLPQVRMERHELDALKIDKKDFRQTKDDIAEKGRGNKN